MRPVTDLESRRAERDELRREVMARHPSNYRPGTSEHQRAVAGTRAGLQRLITALRELD